MLVLKRMYVLVQHFEDIRYTYLHMYVSVR